jgi:hypothetical protein
MNFIPQAIFVSIWTGWLSGYNTAIISGIGTWLVQVSPNVEARSIVFFYSRISGIPMTLLQFKHFIRVSLLLLFLLEA